MNKYFFFDNDLDGTCNNDIKDNNYILLMLRCFKYCSTVSFRIHPDVSICSELNRFIVPTTTPVFKLYQSMGESCVRTATGLVPFTIVQYELSEPVREFILSASNSIWGWIKNFNYDNPEDISFFRPDGTVFLQTCTHDGECALTPLEHEDVDDIILGNAWVVVS